MCISCLGQWRYYKRQFKMSSSVTQDVPWGTLLLQKLNDKCCPRLRVNRLKTYRASIFILTYLAYCCYHLSRKPISVVKTVLHRNCTGLTPPPDVVPDANSTWCDWAPFDGTDSNASTLLGFLDSSFLFCYALAMFISGLVAERVNLRYFLSVGMLMSGIFCYLFGIAKSYSIHYFIYYALMQAMAGIFQTTGWPSVVTVMGNWFGKKKRGLLFGIWNSHTSVGNILGTVIASYYVETDWALSFIMPGLAIGVAGFIIFLFLVTSPGDVGITSPDEEERIHNNRQYRKLEDRVANNEDSSGISSETDDTEIILGEEVVANLNIQYSSSDDFEVQRRIATERTTLLPRNYATNEERAIGFWGACQIPGVIEFSLALFFAKLVSYTFLYWLPLYVAASTTMGASLSADLSTLFDVGGIVGAVAAGVLSDQTGMPAVTCGVMLILAGPMMFLYETFGTISLSVNMILLFIVGFLVNGPYALITTAVSAELGTHSSLDGNSKALATVTAIIDGTGSIGAAVGPLLAGFVSGYGWGNVFIMLIISNVLALLLLMRPGVQEMSRFFNARRQRQSID